jgi:hypothetical protein
MIRAAVQISILLPIIVLSGESFAMDPITTALIAGLTAGATSGATETVKKAISDGYESLKSLVKKKFENSGDIAEAIEGCQ